MDRMRDVLRKEMGRSLQALPELDRLRAAWTVACGRQMAERGRIWGFAEGVIEVEADDAIWLAQMMSMRGLLQHDLARIAAVQVKGIHFRLRVFGGQPE